MGREILQNRQIKSHRDFFKTENHPIIELLLASFMVNKITDRYMTPSRVDLYNFAKLSGV